MSLACCSLLKMVLNSSLWFALLVSVTSVTFHLGRGIPAFTPLDELSFHHHLHTRCRTPWDLISPSWQCHPVTIGVGVLYNLGSSLQGFMWLWSNMECHATSIVNGTQRVIWTVTSLWLVWGFTVPETAAFAERVLWSLLDMGWSGTSSHILGVGDGGQQSPLYFR